MMRHLVWPAHTYTKWCSYIIELIILKELHSVLWCLDVRSHLDVVNLVSHLATDILG